MQRNICIIGGGNLGHVISGFLAHKGLNVSILTRRPDKWSNKLIIHTPHGKIEGKLSGISDKPQDVIPQADVVLLTVPGSANKEELLSILSYLKPECYVGAVFCSSGFFFEAMKILPKDTPLWGFQRVPFIARVSDYGKEATITGDRPLMKIAVENVSQADKEKFANWIQDCFGNKVQLMKNYWEVSITNSNPILHTARLYTLFSDWDENKRSPENIPFYKNWTLEASELLVAMDRELFKILKHLPVTEGYLTTLLDHYESKDALSMQRKISSIKALQDISSPMKLVEGGWIPDYTNRYFTEDFGYSLKYIRDLGHKFNVDIPNIDKVYNWGISVAEE